MSNLQQAEAIAEEPSVEKERGNGVVPLSSEEKDLNAGISNAVKRAYDPVSPLVLIVDDDITTTRVLEGLLRSVGLDTICAHNVANAETLANTRPVSLMLLDIHLPDGNGLDLCRRLMGNPSLEGIPILFISANDDVSVKVQGFSAGAVDYITKPLAGAEVIARVRTHLRLRAAYDSLVKLQTERIQRLADTQHSLMPHPSDLPEASFYVCVRQTLQAGGDFYDVITSGNRIIDYIVADASGHDLGVSLWTASFKALLREYATLLNSPVDICRMINQSLLRLLPEEAFFSVLYVRVNRSSSKISLINAGHPPAILISVRDRKTRVLNQDGDLLGIYPNPVFGMLEIPVKPGDRFFMYSDGLIEAGGSRDNGIQLLEDLCLSYTEKPLEKAISLIVDEITHGQDPKDDIVLLGVDI